MIQGSVQNEKKKKENRTKTKLKSTFFLKLSGQVFLYFRGVPTIIHKIFETNSSFHMKYCSTRKVKRLFFKSILLVLTKFSFWQEEWTLGYHSMNFRHFPNNS